MINLESLANLPEPLDSERPHKLIEAESQYYGFQSKYRRFCFQYNAAKEASRNAETAANWEATYKATEEARIQMDSANSGISIWSDEVERLRWQWHRDTVLAAVEKALNSPPRRRRKAAK